ncbi:hypothetical protein L1987_73208 [Smallanthus sonchifolius]|uniref:Uncharacterized protein n=1 Tax=Smallanthus sonchifolius TaxID=185202 RepID=A0ACB9A1H0_9ASTR|nr:hypothetical protein L1987_73208 [Smallanthus sonchifolius]
MVMPRCGFPDKETPQHSNKSLHTVSHYQFFSGRPKWPERHLTYAFGSRFPTRFMSPVAQAFRKWATASQYFTFSRATTYQSADLKISFARQDHGDGFPFDGTGGVLAHAFTPTDGRLDKMKDKQAIGKENVFLKESPKKPFEGVSSNKEQNDNLKPMALKSEKYANSEGSDSVEILSFGPNFSTYKSQFEREFSEEVMFI